jgi:hypothetical protein
MFTGKRKDLPNFIRKLQFKLEGNADRYKDERAKLLYAHSRLEGDPVTLVDPMLDEHIQTTEHLIQFLQATYGDPNRALTAMSKLDGLRQGKRAFILHFAEFRRLAADTKVNEEGLIAVLRRSLSSELRRAMVGIGIPNNLNEYANLIAAYDNDLRYLPNEPRSRTITHQKDSNAIEIDASHGYAPLGSKEREKRVREGRCFKCGSKDHISPDCSAPLPQIRASSVKASPSRDRRAKSSSSSTSSRGRRTRRGSSSVSSSPKAVSRR